MAAKGQKKVAKPKIGDVIIKLEKARDKAPMFDMAKPFKREYLGKRGIWILLGREKGKKYYVSLNVGKSKNIGSEILYDVACLNFVGSVGAEQALVDAKSAGANAEQRKCEPYINQHNENCKFDYLSGQTQEFLYPFLAKKYEELVFVYAFDGDTLDRKNWRKYETEIGGIEKKIALATHSLYWRNGGAFKDPDAADDAPQELEKYKEISDVPLG